VVPTCVERTLAGPGRPLEPTLQQDMEQRFGNDFSQVRVHSGAAAERSAREVQANAYTVGPNIVFGAGQFAPHSHEVRRSIAHELTHVVQQSGGKSATSRQSAAAKADAPASTTRISTVAEGAIQRQVSPTGTQGAEDDAPLFTLFVANPHKRRDT